MVEVRLYSGFRKKTNSTLTPKGEGKTLNMLFKDNTSVLDPILVYQADATTDLYPWNYLYIPMLGYWYFINDIVSVKAGIWELYCNLDVLGTYKEDILSTNAYIMRATVGYNKYLADSFCIKENDSDILVTSSGNIDVLDTAGSIVLLAMSDTAPASYGGLVGAYQTNLQNAKLCMEELATLYAKDDDQLIKWLTDVNYVYRTAFDAFRSCVWIPVANGKLGSSYERVVINGKQFCGGYVINRTIATSAVDLTIHHNYNDFRDILFTNYELFLPGVGNVALDPTYCGVHDIVSVYCAADYCGNISYKIEGLNNYPLGAYAGNCSISIPINAMSQGNGAGFISGIQEVIAGTASMVFGAYDSNALMTAGGIGTVVHGTYKAITSADLNVYMSRGNLGGSGAASLLGGTNARLSVKAQKSTLNYSNVIGRPVNKMGILSDYVGGYVQTANASVLCNAADTIRSLLNNKLDGGIYLE